MEKVLIIGLGWPEPNSTAAGGRMLQLILFFLGRGHHITFACAAAKTEISLPIVDLGINEVSVQLNHDGFDTFIKTLDPGIVVFDRFITEEQFGWRVKEQVPHAVRILDTEDLHSLRATRQENFASGTPFTTDNWLKNDKTKRELASIYRCDCSLIISSYELYLLQEVIKIDGELLLHLPFLPDPINKDQIRSWTPFGDRNDFIFVGNGKHPPNIDAIKWLKQEIWPAIRQLLPKAKLTIHGSYLPDHIMEMNQPETGFYVLGYTADIKEAMGRARVNLAPLRFGAGLKGKLVDAMVCGTPSITTGIGAEAMHGGLPWGGFIEDDPQQFAEAAVLLHTHRKIWEKSQQNGIAIINRYFDKKGHSDKFNERIKLLQDNLETHRCNNFIGAMLWHQSMASTKYLSHWIELKNR